MAGRRGFTVIELLVSIGIIGVLASVVIIAINPSQNIDDSHDAADEHHAKQIQNAMLQYLVGRSAFLKDAEILSGRENARSICQYQVTTDPSCVNLDELIPEYMAGFTKSRRETNANYLGFIVYKDGSLIRVIPGSATADLAGVFTNGMAAGDILGQYDETSLTAPVGFYTKNTANNGPNKLGYSSPHNIAIDSVDHRLFVLDTANSRVLVYDLTVGNQLMDRIPDAVLGQAGFGQTSGSISQSTMASPAGVAYDTVNKRLFVSDTSWHRVLVFDATTITNGESAAYVLGQANFTSLTSGVAQGRLNFPEGLTYDSTGNRLFVADRTNNRVMVFDTASLSNGQNAIFVLGQTLFTTTTAATTQAGMSGPVGVAFDASGQRLFVACTGNHRTLVYNVAAITNGENAVNVLGQGNFTSGGFATTQAGQSFPSAVAYDGANQRLFVSTSFDHRVLVYDVTAVSDGEGAAFVLGQSLFTTGTSSNTQSKLMAPLGLGFDAGTNRLYVGDTQNHRVMIFDVAAVSNGEPATDMLGHFDDSVSAPAPVYGINTLNNGPNRWGFSMGYAGMAIDTNQHRLFVSDAFNRRVLVYDLNASNTLIDRVPDFVLGQSNFYSNTVGFAQWSMLPNGLAFDSAGNRLFVSDMASHRVLVFDVATITNREDAVSVLGQDNFSLFFAATAQDRLNTPHGLAYDSMTQRLYVADQANSRVMVFDVSAIVNGENAVNVLGQTLFTTATRAVSASAMDWPYGVSVDAAGQRLFVADAGNNRVTVFDVSSVNNGDSAVNVLGQANLNAEVAATTQAGMSGPSGVAYFNNQLIVADRLNHRVLTYDVASITDGEDAIAVLGQINFTGNSFTWTQTGLNSPDSVFYDAPNNRLYVSDGNNDRVMVFEGS